MFQYRDLTATSSSSFRPFTNWCRGLLSSDTTRTSQKLNQFENGIFKFSSEVAEALAANLPVVALESTIISHGMPFPQNLETALVVESIVRENGSVPATIAVLDGKINVGLTLEGLEKLAKLGNKAKKCSRRDLAVVMAQGLTGATTVSGTMVIAHRAGIKIFVTGGIGGVHRDGENTMDISADLTELGKTPVAVICAGVKSILSIEKTLEYLETQGVTVTTFGERPDFPAFFTSKSGFMSPSYMRTVDECAALIHSNFQLQLQSGIVIAVPIPEQDSADAKIIQQAIDNALVEARDQKIYGKDVTPYLLQRISEETKGASLNSNIALVKNNARIGSLIAKSFTKIGTVEKTDVYKQGRSSNRATTIVDASQLQGLKYEGSQQLDPDLPQSKLLIIGGISMDIISTFYSSLTTGGSPSHSSTFDLSPYFHTSSPGTVQYSLGGVARNIAETAHRLSVAPIFVSIVGRDWAGRWLLEKMQEIGMETAGIQICDTKRTAVYNALHNADGQLICAVADMDCFAAISTQQVSNLIKKNPPNLVCFDGNISTECIKTIIETCASLRIPAFFEPTSIPKSLKLFTEGDSLFTSLLASQTLRYISPNQYELSAMYKEAESRGLFDGEWFRQIARLNIGAEFQQGIEKMIKKNPKLSFLLEQKIFVQAVFLLPYIPTLIIKLGKHGVLLAQLIQQDQIITTNIAENSRSENEIIVPNDNGNVIRFKYFDPISFSQSTIVNVTGAGDSLVGTLVAGITLYGDKEIDQILARELTQRQV
ncbi:hypothetical protein G9A89_008793 [Geosiphon pyriformis]|nr:hypothetical protein G9A89_008793 [Geosiphon pyriformis]